MFETKEVKTQVMNKLALAQKTQPVEYRKRIEESCNENFFYLTLPISEILKKNQYTVGKICQKCCKLMFENKVKFQVMTSA